MPTVTNDTYSAASGQSVFAGKIDPGTFATQLVVSFSSTGSNNVPATVTVTPNGPIQNAGTSLLAVDNGALAATLFNWTIGQTTPQTTTLTRTSSGVSTVTMTNSMGLTNTGSGSTFTSTGVSNATSATITLSPTGTTGVATIGYVSLNGNAPASGSISLSGGAGATVTPSTVSWTTSESGANKSFTVQYSGDGTHSLSATSSIAGVSMANSPVSHTTSPAVSLGNPQPFTLTSSLSDTLPFAIGYAMAQGHVPAGSSLSFAGAAAKLAVLSTWPDGSARHGIIAGTYTSAGSTANVTPTVATVVAGTALTGAAVQTAMGANTAVFDAGAFGSATFSGADFATPFKTHAATDTFIEAIYRKQIGSDAHLVAWLSMRVWSSGQVEALPWVENGFMRVAGPTSKSATYSFTLGGTSRFSALIDLPHHARTPLVSGALLSHWLATDPAVVPKHNADYMMSTRLVPTYSATVSPAAAVVTALPSTYTPLQVGSYTADMPSTGYHPDIGLLPEWDVLYLTSTASSVWGALQRNAYSAGRWGIYYRDEGTNRIPRFSTNANWSTNSSTTNDLPPTPTGTSPGSWDVPHHPSMGYMAYLVTGRWFHLETCQFTAAYNGFFQPSGTREGASCVFLSSSGAATVRGAGWAMRSLAQAASITPDSDTTIKAELITSLEANINWNHARYVAQANNPYGIVQTYGDAYGTGSDGKVTGAPWQQDFYTASWGYALAANPSISTTVKTKLQQVFAWLAQSVVGRLQGAGATEWLYRDAAQYNWVVALTDTPDWTTGTGPWPSSWGAMYDASFAVSPGPREPGDLRGGNFPAATSYWGNMWPALAYAVEHAAPGAVAARQRMTAAANYATLASDMDTNPVWSVIPPDLPAWLAGAAVNQWVDIAGTALSSVVPTPTPYGNTGPSSKIGTWCGAALKRSTNTYYIAAAGGHQDYAGNEVNALDLMRDAPTWVQLRAPSANNQIIGTASPGYPGSGYPQFFLDNRPAPTHTYSSQHYIPAQDRVITFYNEGWTGNGQETATWPGGYTYTGSSRSASFNLATGDWDTPDYVPQWNPGGDWISRLSVQHPVTGDVYLCNGLNSSGANRGLWRYNAASNTLTQINVNTYRSTWYCGAAIDPTRSRMLLVGDYSGAVAPLVLGLDGNTIAAAFGGLGASVLTFSGYPGVVYDEINDRFLVFQNTTTITVYAVNASTWDVSLLTTTGTAPAQRPNGIHNSVQYVPSLGGVVIANSYTGNVKFLRIA